MSTVEEYLASFADNERVLLESALVAFRNVIPEANERISYGVIRMESVGGHPLYIGGGKTHVGIYPVPIADAELETEIAPYRSAEDSLHFRYDKPMPRDLIERVASFVTQQSSN